MGRRITSIISGLAIGLVVILIIRVVALTYYEFPDDLIWSNPEDMKTYLDSLPDAAFILLISSHIVGAFLTSLIASLISVKTRFADGIIAGAIIFVIILISNFTFDFPVLYLMIDTLLSAVAAFAGASFGQGRDV
ncbi:MAG: hypothetical protein AAGA77_10895 [Bacteroidota bacterium]